MRRSWPSPGSAEYDTNCGPALRWLLQPEPPNLSDAPGRAAQCEKPGKSASGETTGGRDAPTAKLAAEAMQPSRGRAHRAVEMLSSSRVWVPKASQTVHLFAICLASTESSH
jgi:hypothetical protein